MRLTKKDVCTIPNLLSLVRLLLIPVFAGLYLTAQTDAQRLAAAFVVLASSLTDMLDGWIARRFHQISELGKLLDPVADKLTHCIVALCMALQVPGMWILLIFLIAKELFMGLAGLIILKKNGHKLGGAKWFGKLSTIVFDIVLFVILFLYPSVLPDLGAGILLAIAGGFLALSLLLYIPEFVRMYRLPKRTQP